MADKIHFFLNTDSPDVGVKEGDITMEFGGILVIEKITTTGSNGSYSHEIEAKNATQADIMLKRFDIAEERLKALAALYEAEYGHLMTPEERQEWHEKYVKYDRHTNRL